MGNQGFWQYFFHLWSCLHMVLPTGLAFGQDFQLAVELTHLYTIWDWVPLVAVAVLLWLPLWTITLPIFI